MEQQKLQECFAAQHTISRSEPQVPWAARQDRLRRLMKLVKKHRHEIAAAISQDFGQRSVSETMLLEVFPTLEGIRYALRHGKSWMKPRKVQSGLWFRPAKSQIVPQPKGVVGIIAPWNYPLYLTTGPLIAAFVAGNRAMVKLSEYAPAFATWMQQTVPQYFGEEELAIVTGEAEVAAAFAALPFDHLLFTGSGAVARHVMRAAADNLTPLTLELGGKSPCLLLDDADVNNAAARIMAGKLLNAGQTCIAPDYVLLPQDKIADFIEGARAWVKAHYPNIRNSADYSRIINARQYSRLQAYVDEAKERGAQVLNLCDAVGDEAERFFPPFLVSDLPSDTALLQEEIFGPVLPLLPYAHEDEALTLIRQYDRPLALYLFTTDTTRREEWLQKTVSGGVSVNDTIFHVAQENLPFGGIGASGMGAYHGKAGFDAFTHEKSVFIQARWNGAGLLAPPYGLKFKSLLKLLLR